MDDLPPLPECDVRQMVRLLGETLALSSGEAAQKRHLMEGICRLVEADYWVWVLVAEMTPGELPVYVGFHHGGFSGEQFEKYLTIQQHPDMAWITEPLAKDIAQANRTVTRSLAQIVPETQFDASEVGRLWCDADVKPRLLCGVPIPGGGHSGVALYRRYHRPPFTEQQARLVHILMSEVPWLHQRGWPEDRGATVPRLYPRQRMVLELLLQSYARKQIADQMNITLNTVNGYVKDIYRAFQVKSHAELMSRFYRGDGGDVSP